MADLAEIFIPSSDSSRATARSGTEMKERISTQIRMKKIKFFVLTGMLFRKGFPPGLPVSLRF